MVGQSTTPSLPSLSNAINPLCVHDSRDTSTGRNCWKELSIGNRDHAGREGKKLTFITISIGISKTSLFTVQQ